MIGCGENQKFYKQMLSDESAWVMRFCKDSDLLRCWVTAFDQHDVMIARAEYHNFDN